MVQTDVRLLHMIRAPGSLLHQQLTERMDTAVMTVTENEHVECYVKVALLQMHS